MAAVVLADLAIEPRLLGRRSYAPELFLALGWVGLFAYCAAYLSEDMPFRAPSTPTVGEPLIDPSEDMPGHVVMVAAPEPAMVAAPPAVVAAPASPILGSQPAGVPAVQRSASSNSDYVGTWGPTADACGAPSRRHGYFQATITPERAKAGDTICSFRDAHRTGNAWTMVANCGDRARRWSSRVRLIVDGDHLTWTSAWGTSAYVRCNRRAG
ncbi:peptidase inhibitor family I36 protein [Methylobacterium sp. CM6257]